jgi:hypothetical protein
VARLTKNHTLVTTFASRHKYSTLARKDVLQPQTQDLATSETAKQHRLHHGSVAVRAERGEKRVGRLRRKDSRQGAWRAQQRHSAHALPRSGSPRRQPARDRVNCHSSITACNKVSK